MATYEFAFGRTETMVEKSWVTVEMAVEVMTVVGLMGEDGLMLNKRLRLSIKGFEVVVVTIEDKSTRRSSRFSISFCWHSGLAKGADKTRQNYHFWAIHNELRIQLLTRWEKKINWHQTWNRCVGYGRNSFGRRRRWYGGDQVDFCFGFRLGCRNRFSYGC